MIGGEKNVVLSTVSVKKKYTALL